MRILKISTLALACVAGGLVLSQANAAPEGPKGPQAWIDRMCSADAGSDKMAEFAEKRAARVATILQLNDTQKAAFKEIQDVRAKSRADFKAQICANKPDLSNIPSRLTFRQQMLQHRLDALKAETPKVTAFYNGLDDKQKAALETLRGGMMARFMGGPGPMMGHGGGCQGGKGGMGGGMEEPSTEE